MEQDRDARARMLRGGRSRDKFFFEQEATKGTKNDANFISLRRCGGS